MSITVFRTVWNKSEWNQIYEQMSNESQIQNLLSKSTFSFDVFMSSIYVSSLMDKIIHSNHENIIAFTLISSLIYREVWISSLFEYDILFG